MAIPRKQQWRADFYDDPKNLESVRWEIIEAGSEDEAAEIAKQKMRGNEMRVDVRTITFL